MKRQEKILNDLGFVRASLMATLQPLFAIMPAEIKTFMDEKLDKLFAAYEKNVDMFLTEEEQHKLVELFDTPVFEKYIKVRRYIIAENGKSMEACMEETMKEAQLRDEAQRNGLN